MNIHHLYVAPRFNLILLLRNQFEKNTRLFCLFLKNARIFMAIDRLLQNVFLDSTGWLFQVSFVFIKHKSTIMYPKWMKLIQHVLQVWYAKFSVQTRRKKRPYLSVQKRKIASEAVCRQLLLANLWLLFKLFLFLSIGLMHDAVCWSISPPSLVRM